MALRKRDGFWVTRKKFLGILGKLGLISLIPGASAYASDEPQVRTKIEAKEIDLPQVRYKGLKLRSPRIKGQALSQDVLQGDLSTRNLENIRDLLTGRFFGRAVVKAYKRQSGQLLRWGLGSDGAETGCGFYADINPMEDLDNCLLFMTSGEQTGDPVIRVSTFDKELVAGNPTTGDLGGQSSCGNHCDAHCSAACNGKHCIDYCQPQSVMNMYEIISYPADKFASEIMGILETTDIRVIHNELKALIFSDEVLNLGLQHIVMATQTTKMDEIDNAMELRDIVETGR